MLDFGDWLRQQREQRNLNLTQAAGYTGVDPSTFSRIENRRTQATLDTAIRICEGFNIDFSDLISDMVGKQVVETFSLQVRDDVEVIPVLKLNDIKKFLILFQNREPHAIYLLGEFIEQSSIREQELNERYTSVQVTSDDVFRLLAPQPIYQAELAYPSDFGAYQVFQVFNSKGVLSLTDVGIYLREKREKSNLTLANMEDITQRSASVLSRLEGGGLGKIKLATVFNLNEGLGENSNEILNMFWIASQYQASTKETYKLHEKQSVLGRRVTDILVTVARWFQMQRNFGWLNELRENFE